MTGAHDIATDASGTTQSSGRKPRILMAGGGTGGHVYPALAIAGAIGKLQPEATIEFAGTTNHLEWRVVPEAGYRIHPITVSPLHRKLTLRNLVFPGKLLLGLLQSRSLVRSFRPDVVVGTGGYVSGPVLWAAARAGVPVAIQEQNAFAGKTNKLLARHAAQIHIAFEEARKWFPESSCMLSGNPTRPELRGVDRDAARDYFGLAAGQKAVLVFGGSLGSAAMNRVLAERYAELLLDESTVLIWQTGARYFDEYNTSIAPHPRLTLLRYIERMDLAYAASDVVVCRSGAITCSELEVTGSPAILVPSPNVAEDHQTVNALSLSDAGAARLLPESALSSQLVSTVRDLLDDVPAREAMQKVLLKRARPAAAEEIGRAILQLARASQTAKVAS